MINSSNKVNITGTYIKKKLAKAWLSKLLERLKEFLSVKAPKKNFFDFCLNAYFFET